MRHVKKIIYSVACHSVAEPRLTLLQETEEMKSGVKWASKRTTLWQTPVLIMNDFYNLWVFDKVQSLACELFIAVSPVVLSTSWVAKKHTGVSRRISNSVNSH